jgi:hypothetical protein
LTNVKLTDLERAAIATRNGVTADTPPQNVGEHVAAVYVVNPSDGSPGSPGSSLTQAETQAAVEDAIAAATEVGPGTAAAAQRVVEAQEVAVFTASGHLALANANATPLAGSQTLCESVALFPQQANGAANAAAIFVGLTAARQRVLVTPGLTIGPFPGHLINLQDIRIQGTAGDGVEFWVVQ